MTSRPPFATIRDHQVEGSLAVTRFVRVKKAWERLGVCRTTFYEKFIKTNRLRSS